MKDNTVFLMTASIYAGYIASYGSGSDVMKRSDRDDYMKRAIGDAMLLIGKIESTYSAEELKVVGK